jgi:hypothetical protein
VTTDDQTATEPRPETEDANGESTGGEAETLSRALAAIAAQMREIRTQLDRLLTIQIDRVKLKLRAGIFWIATGVLMLVIGVAAAAMGVFYVVAGAAGAFGELFGGRVWAGNLAAGTLTLLSILLVVTGVQRGRQKSELKKLVRKYESREQGR